MAQQAKRKMMRIKSTACTASQLGSVIYFNDVFSCRMKSNISRGPVVGIKFRLILVSSFIRSSDIHTFAF